MWNNTISFYIFFKDIGKFKLERSHKGKKTYLMWKPNPKCNTKFVEIKKLKVQV